MEIWYLFIVLYAGTPQERMVPAIERVTLSRCMGEGRARAQELNRIYNPNFSVRWRCVNYGGVPV